MMSEAADELADRIRSQIGLLPGVVEKRMFGGVAFMLDGNMLVGPLKDGSLLARVGKDAYQEALTRPGASPMTFTGREMSGFVEVRGEGIETDEMLRDWIELARRFVITLPKK
jgi:TfoX/Sxy family transcriptional regulator of competence genes